jgi:hypothetical protein
MNFLSSVINLSKACLTSALSAGSKTIVEDNPADWSKKKHQKKNKYQKKAISSKHSTRLILSEESIYDYLLCSSKGTLPINGQCAYRGGQAEAIARP